MREINKDTFYFYLDNIIDQFKKNLNRIIDKTITSRWFMYVKFLD